MLTTCEHDEVLYVIGYIRKLMLRKYMVCLGCRFAQTIYVNNFRLRVPIFSVELLEQFYSFLRKILRCRLFITHHGLE